MHPVQDDDNAELRSLYDSVNLEVIQRWIAEQRPEDLNIEFKRLERHYAGQLAKASSGFANSAGGVIVWGIETSKNEAGVDCASCVAPIRDAESVCTKLKECTRTSSDPPVLGVEHQAILLPAGDGFIKTYIPASHGAHRALGGHGQFYRRSEVGHHPMTTLEISDLFGRQPRPALYLKVLNTAASVDRASIPDYRGHEPMVLARYRLFLGIENQGRGIAKFPALRLMMPSCGKWLVEDSHLKRIPHLPSSYRDFSLAGGANDVIHSGTHLPVATIAVEVSLREDENLEIVPVASMPDVVLEYVISAEGVRSKAETLVVSAIELLATMRTLSVGDKSLSRWFRDAHTLRANRRD
ncbi:MAG: helix-turn-helix domain-containing protein [Phycisphaerales bacterium]